MSYYLGKIDQINQECVGCGQTFIVDVFVHETKHSFTRRLIMDFTIMKNADVRVNKVNQSNAMYHPPKLYMDLPANELILTDENMENNHHIMGTPDSSIEFSQYKEAFRGESQKRQPLLQLYLWFCHFGFANPKLGRFFFLAQPS